jgi:hypothetical protein
MQHRLREATRVAAVALALAGGVACGDEPTRPTLELCRTPVAVTVSAGVQPEFSWTPACRVDAMRVVRASTEAVQWAILADLGRGRAIVPSVRYGVVPTAALQLTVGAPPALEPGTMYAVTLTVFGPADEAIEVGRQDFTP